MHISHTKSFNIPVLIALATLSYMINVYKICLNTTNYPIFNICKISDIACGLSILDFFFCQLVSPPCISTVRRVVRLVVTDTDMICAVYDEYTSDITYVYYYSMCNPCQCQHIAYVR